MAITILDWALFRGAKADDSGGISGSEFARVGLPILGGCHVCGATVGAYNACPTRSGYLACAGDDDGAGCTGDDGYDTCDEANRDNFAEEYEWKGVRS